MAILSPHLIISNTGDISVTRGVDVAFSVTFKANDVAVDLTGYTVYFTVRKNQDVTDADDSEAIISQEYTSIAVELAPAQNITVSLNASTSDSASILSQVLTGLNTALTGAITASDTILQAFGRVAWALTWRMPKHAITIGYDSSCDIVYNSTQDFTVKMLEAIDLALTSSTFDTPRKIIVKRGTYFQDTVLDLPFDPRLAIEGMPRWETAFGTAGVLVQWRGTGYAGVAPYQVSLKGNTLLPIAICQMLALIVVKRQGAFILIDVILTLWEMERQTTSLGLKAHTRPNLGFLIVGLLIQQG